MTPAEKRRAGLYPSQGYGPERERRRAKRAFMMRVKAERGCGTCGEADPIVLDFHHRDRALKVAPPSRKSTGIDWASLGWRRLVEEIEKCDVLCANCHRRQTARENGWV